MTATMPAVDDVRDCHLYRFWVRHPLTGRRVLGYIGETVRLPFQRLMEHVYDQPWADTIAGWEVEDVTYCGKAEVLAAEAAAIRAERPLYNVEHNLRNPLRITPPDAIRQRRARDAEKRAARWVHPNDRAQGGVPAEPPRAAPAARQPLPAWQVKTYLWAASWALLASSMPGWLARRGLSPVWWHNLLAAALVSAVLLGWGVWRKPDTWKLWFGRAGRLFRFLSGKPKRRRRR